METVAEVVLYTQTESDSPMTKKAKPGHPENIAQPQLLPGQEAFARLKLPKATLLLPGDRFIIRQFSPVVTIGGGVVLDAAPISRRASEGDFLTIMAAGNPKQILEVRIARRSQEGISTAKLVAETGWERSMIETQLAQAVRQDEVLRIGDRWVHAPAIAQLQRLIVSTLDDFHKRNSLVGGIAKEELRDRVAASGDVFAPVLNTLVRDKKVEVEADLVRLPGRGVRMKDEEAESKEKIETAFSSVGLKVPALTEVIAGLKIDKFRAQKIVTLLLRDKVLIKVSDELVFHRSALDALRRQVAEYKVKASKIDVAKFKELTGVTRKYAIPLLEYLDREHVTKRLGDVREIL
jgi:selenocysteine-specific elongation factor